MTQDIDPSELPSSGLHTGTNSTHGSTRDTGAEAHLVAPRHRGGCIRCRLGRRGDRDHGWCNQFAPSLCLHPPPGWAPDHKPFTRSI